MRKADLLQKVDDFLRDKKDSEIYMVRFCVFAVVGFVIYSLLWEKSIEILTTANSENLLKHQNINQISQTLHEASITQDINSTINTIKSQLQSKKELNEYFDKKFLALSNLTQTDKILPDFLDNLATLAKQNDIQILSISNSIKELKPLTFGEKVEVEVEFRSNFKNIINYINDIESSNLIVDLHQISILPYQNEINSKIRIKIFGVKYQ